MVARFAGTFIGFTTAAFTARQSCDAYDIVDLITLALDLSYFSTSAKFFLFVEQFS